MRGIPRSRLSLVIILLGGSITGCATDPTTADEYRALESELEAVAAERDALAEEVSGLEDALAAVETTEALGASLAATDEVLEFLDGYHEAFEAYDVQAVLSLYHPQGEWISDTPPGRDVYLAQDGPFNPMAFSNPIGGFVRWIGTVDFAFDSRGEPQMITNSGGDIYVSYPSSWHFTYLDRECHITAFTVMWLVDTDDGLAVMRHWNLPPQTVLSP